MAKSKVKQITIKTIKKDHLHTCIVCSSDAVWVYSHYLAKGCNGNGIAKCENCKIIREF